MSRWAERNSTMTSGAPLPPAGPPVTPLLLRPAFVSIVLPDGAVRQVSTSARALDVLPASHDGNRVLAALIDGRPRGLHTPLVADGAVAPITAAMPEGERIRRASVGLALLEAARRCGLVIGLGPSLGFGRRLTLTGDGLEDGVDRLRAAMHALVAFDVPFREMVRTVPEVVAHFGLLGWRLPLRLLDASRDGSVPLSICGDTCALSMGPLVPSTRWLDPPSLGIEDGQIFLLYRERTASVPRAATRQLLAISTPPKRATDMSAAHERWLEKLGVHGVGDLEHLCIRGAIEDVIEVAEGFHERRVGDIADEIVARSSVRIICVAGPSASGKTTFLRRLTTQLRVLGVTPRSLSLDDYYRDKSHSPRDAQGKVDFEAFDALDVPLLQGHLVQLLEGRLVPTARYDFATQTSHRHGGTEVQLERGDVLLVEGLHGLNPGLFAGGVGRESVFRVFVNVATALAFDALSRVSVSDVRLLRRIVRDRRQRATSAADNIARWPLVRRGERENIFPHLGQADAVFDSSIIYELGALKVFAERYLLEVPDGHPSYPTALRLRQLLDAFVAVQTDRVPPTSLLREFVGDLARESPPLDAWSSDHSSKSSHTGAWVP